MALTHPFQRVDGRSRVLPRRSRTVSAPTVPSGTAPSTPAPFPSGASSPGAAPARETVVPGTRTPAGLPRDLVVDETGKPRRAVLLAAIMIRRGRSVAEISAATGLPADVVTCLSRAV